MQKMSLIHYSAIIIYFDQGRQGKRGGSVHGASDLGPEGLEFEPWPVHLRCVLR